MRSNLSNSSSELAVASRYRMLLASMVCTGGGDGEGDLPLPSPPLMDRGLSFGGVNGGGDDWFSEEDLVTNDAILLPVVGAKVAKTMPHSCVLASTLGPTGQSATSNPPWGSSWWRCCDHHSCD